MPSDALDPVPWLLPLAAVLLVVTSVGVSFLTELVAPPVASPAVSTLLEPLAAPGLPFAVLPTLLDPVPELLPWADESSEDEVPLTEPVLLADASPVVLTSLEVPSLVALLLCTTLGDVGEEVVPWLVAVLLWTTLGVAVEEVVFAAGAGVTCVTHTSPMS